MGLRTLTWLAVLTTAGPLVSSAQETSPAAEHYRLRARADSLYAAGARVDAAVLYERVVAGDPRDGQAKFRVARGLFEAGEIERAIELAEESIAQGWSGEAEVAFEIARAMGREGRRDEAIEWAERAVAAGLEERPRLKRDEAFAGMRDDPVFRRIAGFPPAGEADRAARWRHDLDFLLGEARRLHASPERIAWSEAWTRRVEELKTRVDARTDEEIALEIQRLLVALGDGHTVLYPVSTGTVRFASIPVILYLFSDGWYVVDTPDERAGLVGGRVVAIGGKPVDGILDDLRPWVSHDNDMGLEWIGPTVLRFPLYLRAMGYGERLDAVVLTIEDPSGRRRDVEVPVGPGPLQPKLGPPAGEVTDATPAWLRRVSENYWHEPRPELDAVYAQLNQVRDDEGRPIEGFASDVRETLQSSAARHLILDLRHNNGGNNFLIWPIVRLVMWHEATDPAKRAWVITGRNTFSAAQNLVNFLDRETGATFVGEPSSSRPNFVGEDTWVELPYSGLRGSISSRYWQDSFPGDERPWVPVEMPVELSSEAYFGDRDPVMEALARLLGTD